MKHIHTIASVMIVLSISGCAGLTRRVDRCVPGQGPGPCGECQGAVHYYWNGTYKSPPEVCHSQTEAEAQATYVPPVEPATLTFAPEERCIFAQQEAGTIVRLRDDGYSAAVIHQQIDGMEALPDSTPKRFPGLTRDLDRMTDDLFANPYIDAHMAKVIAARSCGWQTPPPPP